MSKLVTKDARGIFSLGGVIASVILILFGVITIGLGVAGRSEVRDNLALENIVGSPDMTRTEIVKAADEAGLSKDLYVVPKTDVAGEDINTGDKARAFAGYMRIHALEASTGLTYAQMGRFATADGSPAGTNDEKAAVKDESGNPVSNGARNTWVTETALTTALNVAYFGEQVALFSMVIGVALLLSGIGFLVLTLFALRKPQGAAAESPVKTGVALEA